MTAQDHAEPMLPDALNGRSETPFEEGRRLGLTDAAYDSRSIPTQHRRDHARGFVRGRTARARQQAEERA